MEHVLTFHSRWFNRLIYCDFLYRHLFYRHLFYRHLFIAIDFDLLRQSLWLTKNRLITLPGEIGLLTNLTALFVDENVMTHLPQEMGNMISLRKLSLRYNRLVSLPPTLCGLTNLRELYLVNNKKIESFPESYTELKSLQTMSLDVGLLGSFSIELLGWVTNLQDLQYTGRKAK